MGAGAAGLAAWRLAGGGVGPAEADTALDLQILQTASSLEALSTAFYDRVLGDDSALGRVALPRTREALTTFARETRRQHAEHKKAFQAQAAALAPQARVQDAPNPKFLPLVTGADVSTPQKLVEFAALVEKVATDTYLSNLAVVHDAGAKAVMASVLAVEAQHLAVLRVLGTLLQGGTPELFVLPFPLSGVMSLPVPTGKVAFPEAMHAAAGPDGIAEPASGAVG